MALGNVVSLNGTGGAVIWEWIAPALDASLAVNAMPYLAGIRSVAAWKR
jgi:hypothetical protein